MRAPYNQQEQVRCTPRSDMGDVSSLAANVYQPLFSFAVLWVAW
jgi:hypothetical protein